MKRLAKETEIKIETLKQTEKVAIKKREKNQKLKNRIKKARNERNNEINQRIKRTRKTNVLLIVILVLKQNMFII